MREVKGRRTGRDFRSRGGRIVFFCGFGKRKPPERERLGLKLERARLMTDQFCAAGSQAQRGAACARVPDFPLCGGWEWVGCGCWALGAGQWALGIAGNPHSGGVVAAVHPLVERWSRWWSDGAAAGGRGNPAVQTQDWQTVDKRTAPNPSIDTHWWRRGSTAPSEYTEHRPDTNGRQRSLFRNTRGLVLVHIVEFSAVLLCRCHCRPFCPSPDGGVF